MDIEQKLLAIREREKTIHDAAVKRDQSILFYRRCIAEAHDVYRKDTADDRYQLENLMRQLKTYCDENPPTKGKSHKFAGGKFGYGKQPPKFFVDGQLADAKNPALLDYVKGNCPQFVKLKESVDWETLKKNIYVEDDMAYLQSTGEVIPEMKVQIVPDKFTVRTTDSPLQKALDLDALHTLNEEDDADDETD